MHLLQFLLPTTELYPHWRMGKLLLHTPKILNHTPIFAHWRTSNIYNHRTSPYGSSFDFISFLSHMIPMPTFSTRQHHFNSTPGSPGLRRTCRAVSLGTRPRVVFMCSDLHASAVRCGRPDRLFTNQIRFCVCWWRVLCMRIWDD